MANNHALIIVDRLMRDIMRTDILFGGKVFVCGGDFRQTLPVVINGNRIKILQQSIKYFEKWNEFRTFKLSLNMRAAADGEFSR
jgi:hypothetical protein